MDFSAAGTLTQEIQVVGPSGHDVVVDTRDLGLMSKEYMYEPEEAGKYRIYVRYGGFELPGESNLEIVVTVTPSLPKSTICANENSAILLFISCKFVKGFLAITFLLLIVPN